jgi:hypothetical protein
MPDRGWLIVCGVLLVVGLFNLGLVLSVLRNRGRREPYLQGSLSDLLNPWKKEDEALDQLHRQVKKLEDNQRTELDEKQAG